MPEQETTKVPRYLRHRTKTRDRAFCWIYEGGKRRQVYLGDWGSPPSKRRFREIVAGVLLSGDERAADDDREPSPTIEEVVARFLHCRQPEVSASEWERLRYSAKPLLDLYRDEFATAFGPKKLRRVRAEMEGTKTLSRGEINRRIQKIRSIFKWAVGEELLPPRIWESLRAVEPLRHGRTTAHESPGIEPVPEKHLRKTLPHLTPTLRAMVELQLATGMRPGELVQMRMADIDRKGNRNCWVYTPRTHKTAHLGHTRRVALGPRARAILEPFVHLDPEAPLFSPVRSAEERRAMRRTARKSKVTPSQQERDQRRREHPRRKLTEAWRRDAYRNAVHAACLRASVPPWSPGQLRHNFEDQVERQFGLEAASRALGHVHLGTTQHYRTKRDLSVAIRVAEGLG